MGWVLLRGAGLSGFLNVDVLKKCTLRALVELISRVLRKKRGVCAELEMGYVTMEKLLLLESVIDV